MLTFAQTVNQRYLNMRLQLLGRCSFGLILFGLLFFSLSGHAESPAQVPASKTYMLWPLLPGETLQSLAEQLYPQSAILQQRFIQQSITLNRNHKSQSVSMVNLSADTQFQSPQLIVVPREQALTVLTHRIKKAEELLVSQHQNMAMEEGQPFSDHRLSFQLSLNAQSNAKPSEQPSAQQSSKSAQVAPTNPEIVLPKIVFEDPPAASAQVEIKAPAITSAPKTQLPNQTTSNQLVTKASASLNNLNSLFSVYSHKAKANLQANIHAFQQGNLNDWLRHPQLKWLCLEGLVLVLLVLYALIEMRLKRRESLKEVS